MSDTREAGLDILSLMDCPRTIRRSVLALFAAALGACASPAVSSDGGIPAMDTGTVADDAGGGPPDARTANDAAVSEAGSGIDVGSGEDAAPPATRPFGEPCTLDEECRVGLACAAGRCAGAGATTSGGACAASVECASGLYCSEGTCAPHRSGAVGASCFGDAECGTSLRCDLSVRACVAAGTVDVGGGCSADGECLGGLRCEGTLCVPAFFDSSNCLRPQTTTFDPGADYASEYASAATRRVAAQPGEFVCLHNLTPPLADGDWTSVANSYGGAGRNADGTYDWRCANGTALAPRNLAFARGGVLWVQVPLLIDQQQANLVGCPVLSTQTGDVYAGNLKFQLGEFVNGERRGYSTMYETMTVQALDVSSAESPGTTFLSFIDDLEAGSVSLSGTEADNVASSLAAARALVAAARTASVTLGYGGLHVTGTVDCGGLYCATPWASPTLDVDSLRIIDAVIRNAHRTDPYVHFATPLVWGRITAGLGVAVWGWSVMLAESFLAGTVVAAVGAPAVAIGALLVVGGCAYAAAVQLRPTAPFSVWVDVARTTFPSLDQVFNNVTPSDSRLRDMIRCGDTCMDTSGRDFCSSCPPGAFCRLGYPDVIYTAACNAGSCEATATTCPASTSCSDSGGGALCRP